MRAVEAVLSSGRAAGASALPCEPSLQFLLSSPKKSSKNNRLYFTQSVRSRLEKCSSRDSLPCVENSSASRAGGLVLLPHGLEGSPALAARPRAFGRELNLSAPAFPFSVSCFVFSRAASSESSVR